LKIRENHVTVEEESGEDRDREKHEITVEEEIIG